MPIDVLQVADVVRRTEKALAASSADPGAPLVIYVSKMVAVPVSALPRCVCVCACVCVCSFFVFLCLGV